MGVSPAGAETLPAALLRELAAVVGEAHVLTGDAAAGYAVDWTGGFPRPTPAPPPPPDPIQGAAPLPPRPHTRGAGAPPGRDPRPVRGRGPPHGAGGRAPAPPAR